MKKLFFLLLLVYITFSPANAQTKVIDSLKAGLFRTRHDTIQLVFFDRLGEAYENVNYDSSSFYSRKAYHLAQELGYPLHEAKNLLQEAIAQIITGNPAGGLELLNRTRAILDESERSVSILPTLYLQKLQIPTNLQNPQKYRLYLVGKVYQVLALMHLFDAQREKAKAYILKAKAIAETLPSTILQINNSLFMGNFFVNEPDSALLYLNKGYQIALQSGNKTMLGDICNYIAKAYHLKKDKAKELYFRRASLHYNLEQENIIFVGWSYLSLADYFRETPQTDSTIFYCHKAIEIAQDSHTPAMEFWSYAVLKDLYKKINKPDSAFAYMERMLSARDRSAMDQQARQLQAAEYNQLMRQKELATTRMQYQNKIRMYALIGGLIAVLLIAGLMWRNMRHRQKAFALLQQQKKETEKAYEQLKSTQQQLIQKEKMASLGELTAGIAHEIQNPLNFVNNFSAVNKELLSELRQEAQAGNTYEVLSLADTIEANEQKIEQHGQRADNIVKGMLQHARTSTGEKEPTDLNKLVDEYLRLSYQGIRTKDKDFAANIETHFDTTIDVIRAVPQDIGRVLLNLFNNAFHAVSEKKKQLNGTFEPLVSVSTKKEGNNITITVQDNGTGMSPKVAEKAFQPFFTTKPTGEGTGLGLSLSYDIVTKGHGGELRVESKEGEGATFIIQLPKNS